MQALAEKQNLLLREHYNQHKNPCGMPIENLEFLTQYSHF